MRLVRPSRPEDVDFLAQRLRPADVEEVLAAGSNPLDALSSGLDYPGAVCLTGLSPATGEPILMFGAAPSSVSIVGFVWLLGTPEIERHRVRFMREAARWVEALNDEWPVLTNAVYEKNTVHIHWLRRLGFQLVRRSNNPNFIEFVRLKCANPLPSP